MNRLTLSCLTKINPVTWIIILGLAILMFQGANISINSYNSQLTRSLISATNQSDVVEKQRLSDQNEYIIKAIGNSTGILAKGIVDNQIVIKSLAQNGSSDSRENLNKTLYNRASLEYSMYLDVEIAKKLGITIKPFNASKFIH